MKKCENHNQNINIAKQVCQGKISKAHITILYMNEHTAPNKTIISIINKLIINANL